MAEKTEKPLPTWKFILQCVAVPIIVSLVASGGTVAAAWFMTVRKQVSESVGAELRLREAVRELVPKAVAAVTSSAGQPSPAKAVGQDEMLDHELRARWVQQQDQSQQQEEFPADLVREELARYKQRQEQEQQERK